jgi:hypothetical protein
LGVIDEEGRKVEANSAAFVQHKEEAFAREFEGLVKEAYPELFELHGDAAWDLDKGSLVQFFRTSDHSSQVVGTRQAGTFAYLAGLSGHSELPAKRGTAPQRKSSTGAAATSLRKMAKRASEMKAGPKPRNEAERAFKFGLTVRVEVNLPAEGDQQTYDMIFRSIRKNLIDGE